MSVQPFIAVGAALASALLFLVLAQGSLAGILALFAPLPIMIAALGWGHRTGLLAAGIASLFFLPALSLPYAITYLIEFGLPAWYLAFLALLARSGAADAALPSGAAPQVWYPLGHLVLWSAGIAAALVALSLFALMSDASEEAMKAASRNSNPPPSRATRPAWSHVGATHRSRQADLHYAALWVMSLACSAWYRGGREVV